MSTMYLTFRGEEVEIEYRDYGYEHDTNAHDVDWRFVDENVPQPTDEENEALTLELYKRIYDSYGSDEP